jgi:hypothetical protein
MEKEDDKQIPLMEIKEKCSRTGAYILIDSLIQNEKTKKTTQLSESLI